MEKTPFISLCMIVKNEGKCIERCLQSIQHVVDEIIVVDTGSTDETIDICKRYNAIIIKDHWENHFAKARNVGISKATGKWILWLDADEEWQGDTEALKECLRNTEASVLSLPVVNFDGKKEPVDQNQAFILYQYRLFRHNQDILFTDAIHERLLVQDTHKVECIKDFSFAVKHYGYLTEYVQNKKKTQRNMAILVQELEKGNSNPWLLYYLANEYASQEQYQEAFQYINAAILAFIKQEKMPPSILYRLKYGILVETGNVEGAWPAIDKALILYPDYVDLHYYKGHILYCLGRYEESIQSFERCIELGEDHESHLVFRGTGSFRAWEQIAMCWRGLGEESKAEAALKESENFKK